MENLYIIILTYNNEPYITRVLQSIKGNFSLSQVIIVDNNSSDRTVQIVHKKYPLVTMITSQTNDGYGAGNNKGISLALKRGAKYIFIINPDIVLPKAIYINLLKVFTLDQKIGIVGPTVLDENGLIWGEGGIIDPVRYSGGLINFGKTQKNRRKGIVDVDYVSGTAILIKREVFETIGLFPTNYFLYYEDVDFSHRAKKEGFRVTINRDETIVHYASSSVGKNSPAMQYYMARNHLLFLETFAPLYTRIRELIRLPKTLYQARDRTYELLGIRDYFLRRFGKRDYWS